MLLMEPQQRDLLPYGRVVIIFFAKEMLPQRDPAGDAKIGDTTYRNCLYSATTM